MSPNKIAEELRRRDTGTTFYLTLMGGAYTCNYCYVGWITNSVLNYDHLEHNCCVRNALLREWRKVRERQMRR